MKPLRALRQRLRRWFYERLPRSDTLALTQRNVYILPTRAGWVLGTTLLLLLVGSINYQLNLGYLLTFLLAGSVVVGMHMSHANLRGLTLQLLPPAPVHAGQPTRLEVRLSSERCRDRYGIGLGVIADGGLARTHLGWTDVPAQGSAALEVAWTAPRRGLHPLPALTALTLFPLGTFRVWTVWRPAATLLVYPAAERHPPPLPAGQAQASPNGPSTATQSPGEFDGVRAYRRGDPQKTIVWKRAAQAFASGRSDLVSRDALGTQRQPLWLAFTNTGIHEREARLSRLTAWVLQADRLGCDYGLRLPGRSIAPAQGIAHKARCLEALATL